MRGSGTSETECPTSERITVSYLEGDALDHARDCPRCRDVEQDVCAIDGWLRAHASSVFDVPLPAVGPAEHGAEVESIREPRPVADLKPATLALLVAAVASMAVGIRVLVPPVSNPAEQNWRGVRVATLEANLVVDRGGEHVVVSWTDTKQADEYLVRFWDFDGSLLVSRVTSGPRVMIEQGIFAGAGPVAWSVEARSSGVLVAASPIREFQSNLE